MSELREELIDRYERCQQWFLNQWIVPEELSKSQRLKMMKIFFKEDEKTFGLGLVYRPGIDDELDQLINSGKRWKEFLSLHHIDYWNLSQEERKNVQKIFEREQ